MTSVFVAALTMMLALTGCSTSVPTSPATTRAPNASTCPVTIAAAPDAVPAPVASFEVGGMILPAGMTPPPLRTFYGNDALWVDLGTSDGTLVGVPEAAGHLGAKFGTYRLMNGSLTVSARRLDGPSGDVRASVPDGYGLSDFQSMGISFPSVGCWSVTETVAGHDLDFVVRVSGPSPAPSASFAVSGASPAFVALVVRFVDAFNAADLETAAALFADDADVSDCDFMTHTVVEAQGRDAIRAWLVGRFADHDRLVIGRIFNANPDSDRAVGVEFALRSSDTIASLGAPDGITPDVSAKVVLDTSGQKLAAFANGPGGADLGVILRSCSIAPRQ